MKNKLLLALGIIAMLITTPVYAGYLNGYTVINEGLYVYTNTQWNDEILVKNDLRSTENVLDKVINVGNEITYDFNTATPEQKIQISYVNMLQKAQELSCDLNTLIPDFIAQTDLIIQNDVTLTILRDGLLQNTSYKHNNKTYLIIKQKHLSFIDTIQNSVSFLKNGMYYINNINKNDLDNFYIVYVVNSKCVVNCTDSKSAKIYNQDGFSVVNNIPETISNISDTLITSYNVINNSEEYINKQKKKNENDNEKADNYNTGGNWLLNQSTATDMQLVESKLGPSANLDTKNNAKVVYNIKTINVPISTKEGRGVNSPYYNECNVEINNVNIKYTNLLEDQFNLCGGTYETAKEESGDYDYVKDAEHIVFERNEKKSPTEVVIKTSNVSYVLMNLKLNTKDYLNSQLIVCKDGIQSQEITIDSAKKDVLIDVSDCNTISFTVRPIAKHIDNVDPELSGNIVFEPGRYVRQGSYSKKYLEENKDQVNFIEYNNMKLYADMYLIF